MDASRPRRVLTTTILTAAALVAFAANSILCRAALDSRSIDPFLFSLLRVGSGAIVLTALLGIAHLRRGRATRARERLAIDWTAAAMLALYLVPFSWAYTRVQAGAGALILFGAVQSTLLAAAWHGGERPRAAQWSGVALALMGIGLATLYSASNESTRMVATQGAFFCVGLGALWLASRIPAHVLKQATPPIYVLYASIAGGLTSLFTSISTDLTRSSRRSLTRESAMNDCSAEPSGSSSIGPTDPTGF